MEDALSFARLFLNISNTIIQNRNRHLEKIGLTASQADCLKFYMDHEGLTIKDYKEAAGITHQTAQGIVRRLLQKGFLSAKQSETDKRSQVLHVTKEGSRLSEIINDNGIHTGNLLVKGMTGEERDLLYRQLKKVYENAKSDKDEVGK